MEIEDSPVMRYRESLQSKCKLLSLKNNDISVAIRANDSVRFLDGYIDETKQNKLAQIGCSIDTTFSGDKCFCCICLNSCAWCLTGNDITVVNGHTQELALQLLDGFK